MNINIDNPETERLISELVDLLGVSQIQVITEAVQEKLDRVRRRGMAERLLAIGRETAPLLQDLPDCDSLFEYLEEEGRKI